LRRQRDGARETVEAAISQAKQHEQEAKMTDGQLDPRLELNIDDLMTLSGAISTALMTMNETDRLRYEALATKLAFILMRTQIIDDPRHYSRHQ
jgi:hypothetical protein